MSGYERKVRKFLKESGYVMERPRGSHDIWSDGELEVSVPSKINNRHTANAILKEAGIDEKL